MPNDADLDPTLYILLDLMSKPREGRDLNEDDANALGVSYPLQSSRMAPENVRLKAAEQLARMLIRGDE